MIIKIEMTDHVQKPCPHHAKQVIDVLINGSPDEMILVHCPVYDACIAPDGSFKRDPTCPKLYLVRGGCPFVNNGKILAAILALA